MSPAPLALLTTVDGMSWLLTCALKAGLLLAAAWLGAALLRRGAAAARHQLWTLGVLGSLLLPLLGWVVPSLAAPAPRAFPAAPSAASIDLPAILVTNGGAPEPAPAWPAALAMAWAAGALVVGLRLARGHLVARRLLRTAAPNVAASWSLALREAASSLALARPVQLLRSEAIASPMTICVWRPRVLLPAGADAWSAARLRAVLVHELGHIRRHDTAIQLAAQLACAIYWWNPLTWLAAARLRLEREHACDDLVLGAGTLPSSYAADLLDVARAMASRAAPTAQTGALGMVDRSGTEARLRRILDAAASRQPLRARARVAISALALAGAVTLACTSAPPELPPEPGPALAAAPATSSLGALTVGEPSLRQPESLRPPAFLQPPALQGELDLALVTAEVKRRLAPLEECYARRLAASPGLAGTVVLHWTIDERGDVPESCITSDTAKDPELATCVDALVRAGRFPAPRGGSVPVSIPFVFTARPTVALNAP